MQETLIESFRLSSLQRHLCVLQPIEETFPFRIHCAVQLEGWLDIPRLYRALERLIERYEILRTRFPYQPDLRLPEQVIDTRIPLPLVVHDCSALSPDEQERAVQRLRESGAGRSFTLNDAPLWQMTLVVCTDERHWLFWDLSALCADMKTCEVLLHELSQFYEKDTDQEEATEALQYADLTEWQYELLESVETAKGREHWRSLSPTLLKDVSLPYEQPAYHPSSFMPCTLSISISSAECARLQLLAQTLTVTPAAVLLTCWGTVLSRLSEQISLPIATGYSGRLYEDLADAVGPLARFLPLSYQLPENARLSEVVTQIEATMNEASGWQEYFDWSLFDTLEERERFSPFGFTYETLPLYWQTESLRWSVEEQKGCLERFNINLSCLKTAQDIRITLQYDGNQFVQADMQRLLTYWQTVLQQVLVSPDVVLGSLQLLTQEEQHALIEEWNPLRQAFSEEGCIHQLFEQQVEHAPDAIALVFEGEALTYASLNRRSNQLAHYLRRQGVAPEVVVGVCMERSVGMIVGLLGVLKAGGSYLPLDPSYPVERLAFMLSDAQVTLVLTLPSLREVLPTQDVQIVSLASDGQIFATEQEDNIVHSAHPEQLAYIIYTSGSTGMPKGVMVEHASVSHLFAATQPWFNFNKQDAWMLFHSYAFDFSVWEIWGALLHGGRLVIVPYEVSRAPEAFFALLERQAVTVLNQTPSAFRQLMQVDADLEAQLPLALRLVIFGGEALDVQSIRPWFERHGDQKPQLVNMYGITETTVHVTYRPLRMQDVYEQVGSRIGLAIPDLQLYILDNYLHVVPTGVAGQLYVGGTGVARGYLNRPELTSERFSTDPFTKQPGARLYQTGDLARFLPDQDIEYLGRIDQQVKIRGFRIELGEIEAQLRQHPYVQECVVLAREDVPGEKRLVAYMVLQQGQTLPTIEARTYLQDRLPVYMIPAVFVPLATLPLTSNSKIDRKKLPVPEDVQATLAEKFVAPRTAIEATLANIWSQLLHVEQIGIHDNFFALGGDSILSIQVVTRAKQAGLQVTPRQLFQNQSIAQLSSVITHALSARAEQALVTGHVPLTPIQHWFFARNFPEQHHYNQAVLLETRQELRPSWIQQALTHMVLHHDALRLRFVPQAEGWQQDIAGAPSVPCCLCIDLSALSASQQQITQATLTEEAQASIDLNSGLLLRALFFIYKSEHPDSLLLIVHHLAIDGVSWRILLEDLEVLCQQLQREERMQLVDKTASWQQWAQRLQEYAQMEELRATQSHWLAPLHRQINPLPMDMSSDENTISSSETLSVSLDARETQALLQEVPAAHHTQINDVLLTALTQAFAIWTGQHCLLVDLEGHGREEFADGIDISRTVGWFTTIFPVLLDIEQANDPGQALKTIKEQLRQVPQKGLSYGALRYLNADPQVGEQFAVLPQAEVVFNYLGQFDSSPYEDSLFRPGSASTGAAHSKLEPRNHLLDINGRIIEGKLSFSWRYSRSIHHRNTIQRLVQSFINCLENLIAHCQSLEMSEYTPSDFPLARLNQQQLNTLIQKLPQAVQQDQQIEDIYPLSSMQAGFLFHSLYVPDEGVYCLQFGWTIRGSLNVEAWQWAWHQVITRHSILRTFFVWQGLSEPLQVVCRHVDLPCEIYDWSSLSVQKQQRRLDNLSQENELRGSDLGSPPLLRLVLVHLGAQTFRFHLSLHHLIIDGWSQSLLLAEVQACYQAACEGKTLELTPVRPYRDYIAWLQRQDIHQAEQFWRSYLRGFTTPNRLPGREGAPVRFQTAIQELSCSATLTSALQERTQQLQITLNTLLQGAWALLLSHYSGEEDVLFGATTTGRPAELPGGETMIGVFINTLPVRVRITSNTLLPDWLRQLQAEQVEARQYEYTPLPQIQTWSEVQSGQSLFESLMVFQNYPVAASVLEQSREVAIQRSATEEQTHYPIMIKVVPTQASLKLFLQYDEARFEAAMMTRMLQQLQELLQAIVDHPEQQPGALSLLSEQERFQLLIEWNATEAFYPENTCVHQLFEQQVELTPERIAVVFEDQQVTYRELDQRANQLAHYLQDRGVGPDVLIGVCVENSIEMAVSVLAILKAGGAVVPIDPAYPKERLGLMFADAHIAVLLTQQRLLAYLPETQVQRVLLDSTQAMIALESTTRPESAVDMEHLMYVIYTSGSTGTPKGVSLSHRILVNLLTWHRTNLCEQARTLQFASLSFDASFHEMFAAWITGGTLCIIAASMRRDVIGLANFLSTMAIEKMILPVVMLHQLAEECSKQKRQISSLKEITATGEQLQITQPIVEMFGILENCTLHNHYGPSESHVVTAYSLTGNPSEWPTHPPIGRPIANTQIYVLDEHLKPVSVGVVGELYIGGISLARGYLDHPAMTAERFIPDPFVKGGERLYKTGDLVRYRVNGVIEYLGRRDHQIKMRGYRIELGEIESLLNQHAGVHEVVVLVREDTVGDKQLVAYIVLNQEQPITGNDLHRYLQATLPDYMLPSSFVMLDNLPLTPNGKVDRRTLPRPDSTRPELEVAFVPPRTPAEEIIAGIWAKVIGLEQVGVYDNFFELGGHSLRAVQVISRLRDAFQIELPLRSLFERPTIDGLINEIAQARGGREIIEEIALVLKEIEELSEEATKDMLYN